MLVCVSVSRSRLGNSAPISAGKSLSVRSTRVARSLARSKTDNDPARICVLSSVHRKRDYSEYEMAEFASLARPSDDRLRIAERCLSTAALDFFFFFPFQDTRYHSFGALLRALACEGSTSRRSCFSCFSTRDSGCTARNETCKVCARSE